jgi:hypothetical protein
VFTLGSPGDSGLLVHFVTDGFSSDNQGFSATYATEMVDLAQPLDDALGVCSLPAEYLYYYHCGAAWSCTPGRYGGYADMSAPDCVAQCGPGSFCPGKFAKQSCQSGRYNSLSRQSKSSACKACSPGFFCDTAGSGKCEQCPEGRFSVFWEADNLRACQLCRVEGANIIGAIVCTPAPTRAPTLPTPLPTSPTSFPTAVPTHCPTSYPTNQPTSYPTGNPVS